MPPPPQSSSLFFYIGLRDQGYIKQNFLSNLWEGNFVFNYFDLPMSVFFIGKNLWKSESQKIINSIMKWFWGF
jgi:hypothetical protein